MDNPERFKFQQLDAYKVAREIAVRVHEARISDAELRDQATRAAKSAFLGLCEGLPNEAPGLRRRYFTQSRECSGPPSLPSPALGVRARVEVAVRVGVAVAVSVAGGAPAQGLAPPGRGRGAAIDGRARGRRSRARRRNPFGASRSLHSMSACAAHTVRDLRRDLCLWSHACGPIGAAR